MEVDENEETFLNDSEDSDDNDDEPKTQQEAIEEEAIQEVDKTKNCLGLLSNFRAMCKDN